MLFNSALFFVFFLGVLAIRFALPMGWTLRKVLNEMNPLEAMELMKTRMKPFKTNVEFLMAMKADPAQS